MKHRCAVCDTISQAQQFRIRLPTRIELIDNTGQRVVHWICNRGPSNQCRSILQGWLTRFVGGASLEAIQEELA